MQQLPAPAAASSLPNFLKRRTWKEFSPPTPTGTRPRLAKWQNQEAFTRKGFILQIVAAGGYRKSPEELAELAEKVGRGRVLVCHGGGDQMIAVKLAEALVQQLNAGVAEGGDRVEFVVYEGSGHVLAMEKCRQVGRAIEKLVERTSALPA